MAVDSFSEDDFRKNVIYELEPYFEKTTWGKEIVFEHELSDEATLVILTSIDSRSGRSRREDSDSIKVKIVDEYNNSILLENDTYSHIKRTSGWDERTLDRARELYQKFPENIQSCPECGRPLSMKAGQYGTFKGCTGWDPEDPE